MKKEQLEVVERYTDNGEFSHCALIDILTGNILWSECPGEEMQYVDHFTSDDVEQAYNDGYETEGEINFNIDNYRGDRQ